MVQVREITSHFPEYELVVHATGTAMTDDFSAFIAVHNTKFGKPAIGGCRVTSYNDDQQALADVLKLSKAMTYKNSLAGLNFGGGKTVVNASHVTEKNLAQLGDFLNTLQGIYVTGTDLGTTLEDMKFLAKYTPYVERGDFGDTSFHTAQGIVGCIGSFITWEFALKETVNIWVQGCGKVGMDIIRRLHDFGDDCIKIYVSDVIQSRIDEAKRLYNVKDFTFDKLKSMHIYVPCAKGNIVTKQNISSFYPGLFICGAANNQLENEDVELAEQLLDNGIIYCPDYLVNAGGVMSMAGELEGWTKLQLIEKIQDIADMSNQVHELSEKYGVSQLKVANALAEMRFT